MYCGQFGSMMPTRSPLTMPRQRQRRGQAIGMVLERAERQVAPRNDVAGQLVAARPPSVAGSRRAGAAGSWCGGAPSSRSDPATGACGRPFDCAQGWPSSADRAATVDDDGLAGDVVRRVGGQEHRHALELAGGADAGNGAGGLDLRLGRGDGRIGQARMEEAGRDGVDANALAAPRSPPARASVPSARPCSPHSPHSAAR